MLLVAVLGGVAVLWMLSGGSKAKTTPEVDGIGAKKGSQDLLIADDHGHVAKVVPKNDDERKKAIAREAEEEEEREEKLERDKRKNVGGGGGGGGKSLIDEFKRKKELVHKEEETNPRVVEDAARKREEEERQLKRREEDERRKKEEEEEEARKKKEEEERKKKEEEKKKKEEEEEEAKRKAAEEESRKKKEIDEDLKRKKEADDKKRKEEEEEEAARKKSAEDSESKAGHDSKKKVDHKSVEREQEEEARLKLVEEAKKKLEQNIAKKKPAPLDEGKDDSLAKKEDAKVGESKKENEEAKHDASVAESKKEADEKKKAVGEDSSSSDSTAEVTVAAQPDHNGVVEPVKHDSFQEGDTPRANLVDILLRGKGDKRLRAKTHNDPMDGKVDPIALVRQKKKQAAELAEPEIAATFKPFKPEPRTDHPVLKQAHEAALVRERQPGSPELAHARAAEKLKKELEERKRLEDHLAKLDRAAKARQEQDKQRLAQIVALKNKVSRERSALAEDHVAAKMGEMFDFRLQVKRQGQKKDEVQRVNGDNINFEPRETFKPHNAALDRISDRIKLPGSEDEEEEPLTTRKRRTVTQRLAPTVKPNTEEDVRKETEIRLSKFVRAEKERLAMEQERLARMKADIMKKQEEQTAKHLELIERASRNFERANVERLVQSQKNRAH